MFERKSSGSGTTSRPAGPTPTEPKPVVAGKTLPPAPPRFGAADEGAGESPRLTPAQPVRLPLEAGKGEPVAQQTDARKLIVGRGIAFSAEISACDHLVVEGTVEARLPEAQRVDIAESGLFRGTVGTNDADIGGRFEGELTVRGRLVVRSTGFVDGKVQYGELAVEAGGRIEGELHGIRNKPESKGVEKTDKPAA